MKRNFDDCLIRLLKDEGGYSNDPADSGGPTNFGITLADYQKYIDRAGTAFDVKGMTVDQAKDIYRTKYWNALDCDSLTSGVDYTCFDYGVNSGLGRPRKALAKYKTLKGTQLIDAINDERVDFLHNISGGKNAKFLKGWLARVARVRDYSKTLAKKDNISGPGTAVVIGSGGVVAGMTHPTLITYVQSHPYISTLVIGFVAVLIGATVHTIRNWSK